MSNVIKNNHKLWIIALRSTNRIFLFPTQLSPNEKKSAENFPVLLLMAFCFIRHLFSCFFPFSFASPVEAIKK